MRKKRLVLLIVLLLVFLFSSLNALSIGCCITPTECVDYFTTETDCIDYANGAEGTQFIAGVDCNLEICSVGCCCKQGVPQEDILNFRMNCDKIEAPETTNEAFKKVSSFNNFFDVYDSFAIGAGYCTGVCEVVDISSCTYNDCSQINDEQCYCGSNLADPNSFCCAESDKDYLIQSECEVDCGPAPVPGEGYNIEGYVFNESNVPIEGVTVIAKPGKTNITDENGFYLIKDVEPTDGALTATKDGYEKGVLLFEIIDSDLTDMNIILTEIAIPTETDCSNLSDEDGDGYVDYCDEDCSGQTPPPDGTGAPYWWMSEENNAGNCSDTIDNDCDGSIDCNDPDCFETLSCKQAPVCGNNDCERAMIDGELWDEADPNNRANCSQDCPVVGAACGNNILESEETCDGIFHKETGQWEVLQPIPNFCECGDPFSQTPCVCLAECGDGFVSTSEGEFCDIGLDELPGTDDDLPFSANYKCRADCQFDTDAGVCGNSVVDEPLNEDEGPYEECDGFDDSNCGGFGCNMLALTSCRCNPGCNLEPVAPVLKDVSVTPEEKELTIEWTSETCDDLITKYYLYKCEGQNCLDFVKIEEGDSSFEDLVDDNVEVNSTYCYMVEAFYDSVPIQSRQSNKICEFTGHAECLSDIGKEGEFCKDNTRYKCDGDNEKVALPNREGVAGACGEGMICVIKEDILGNLEPIPEKETQCVFQTECDECNGVNDMFGFSGVAIDLNFRLDMPTHMRIRDCENIKTCYEDSTKTSVNKYFNCANVTSCYDYKSEEACFDNDNCGIGPCIWEKLEGYEALGVGVCKPEEPAFEDCSRCNLDEENEELNSIFGSCEQTCNLYGNCFFDKITANETSLCLGVKDVNCADYDSKELCTGEEIAESYDFSNDIAGVFRFNSEMVPLVTEDEELSLLGKDDWKSAFYTYEFFERGTEFSVFEAKIKLGLTAAIGLFNPNVNSNDKRRNFAHGIQLNKYANAGLMIWENGNNLTGWFGNVDADVWYDIKIELKPRGARYYIKESDTNDWELIYESNIYSGEFMKPGVTVRSRTANPNQISYSDDWKIIKAPYIDLDWEYTTTVSGGEEYTIPINKISGSNEIKIPSNDPLNLSVCRWNDKVGCFRDADGNNWFDCEDYYDTECQSDYEIPETTISLPESDVAIGLTPEIKIYTEEGATTYLCIVLEGDSCYPDFEADKVTGQSYQSVVTIEQLNEHSKQDPAGLGIVDQGESRDYTIYYFSEDASKNIEPVKSLSINIDITPPGIIIYPTVEPEGIEINNIWVTDLKIDYHSTENDVRCDGHLESAINREILFPDRSVVNKLFEAGEDLLITYPMLVDGEYFYVYDCFNKPGNHFAVKDCEIGNNTEGCKYIKIDNDKTIYDLQPEGTFYNNEGIELSAKTQTSGECRYTNSFTKVYEEIVEGDDLVEGFLVSEALTDGGYIHKKTLDLPPNAIYKYYVKCNLTGKGEPYGHHSDVIKFAIDQHPPVTNLITIPSVTVEGNPLPFRSIEGTNWTNSGDELQTDVELALVCDDEHPDLTDPESGVDWSAGCKNIYYCDKDPLELDCEPRPVTELSGAGSGYYLIADPSDFMPIFANKEKFYYRKFFTESRDVYFLAEDNVLNKENEVYFDLNYDEESPYFDIIIKDEDGTQLTKPVTNSFGYDLELIASERIDTERGILLEFESGECYGRVTDLTSTDGFLFTGTLNVPNTVVCSDIDSQAEFRIKAYDLHNRAGSFIVNGGTFHLDTKAPEMLEFVPALDEYEELNYPLVKCVPGTELEDKDYVCDENGYYSGDCNLFLTGYTAEHLNVSKYQSPGDVIPNAFVQLPTEKTITEYPMIGMDDNVLYLPGDLTGSITTNHYIGLDNTPRIKYIKTDTYYKIIKVEYDNGDPYYYDRTKVTVTPKPEEQVEEDTVSVYNRPVPEFWFGVPLDLKEYGTTEVYISAHDEVGNTIRNPASPDVLNIYCDASELNFIRNSIKPIQSGITPSVDEISIIFTKLRKGLPVQFADLITNIGETAVMEEIVQGMTEYNEYCNPSLYCYKLTIIPTKEIKGLVQIKAIAKDLGGKYEEEIWEFEVDPDATKKPVIEIGEPGFASEYKSVFFMKELPSAKDLIITYDEILDVIIEDITISGTVSGEVNELTTSDNQVFNTTFGVLKKIEGTFNEWEFELDIQSYKNITGIEAEKEKALGKETMTTHTFPIVVDDVPPELTEIAVDDKERILGITNPYHLRNNNAYLFFTRIQNEAYDLNVEITAVGETKKTIATRVDDTSYYLFEWEPDLEERGNDPYNIEFKFIDQAGNSASLERPIIIDNTKPIIRLIEVDVTKDIVKDPRACPNDLEECYITKDLDLVDVFITLQETDVNPDDIIVTNTANNEGRSAGKTEDPNIFKVEALPLKRNVNQEIENTLLVEISDEAGNEMTPVKLRVIKDLKPPELIQEEVIERTGTKAALAQTGLDLIFGDEYTIQQEGSFSTVVTVYNYYSGAITNMKPIINNCINSTGNDVNEPFYLSVFENVDPKRAVNFGFVIELKETNYLPGEYTCDLEIIGTSNIPDAPDPLAKKTFKIVVT